MQMSRGVEWALHVCCLLASVPEAKTLEAASLAEFYDLSSSYLAKQLQALARVGIVTPVYGTSGGYRLGRQPSDISVLEVVEAIEGKTALFACTEIRRQGPTAQADRSYRTPCTIAAVMSKAEQAWQAELASNSIADLVTSLPMVVPRPQRTATIAWIKANAR